MRLRYLAGHDDQAFLAEALERFRPAASDAEARRRLDDAFRRAERLTPENKDDFYARMGGE